MKIAIIRQMVVQVQYQCATANKFSRAPVGPDERPTCKVRKSILFEQKPYNI